MGFREIAQRLRTTGREINYPTMTLTQELLALQHETEPYDGIKVSRDIAYGEDERHRLDLFTPEGSNSAAPVALFVHGGGFVRGDKLVPGTPYFDNVALAFARQGMIGATMTYRLAPDAQWPSGGEDVAAAVRYLARDCRKVILLGTSAGATHVATAIAREPDLPVAGAILLSGIFDFADPELAADLAPYIGDDAGSYAARSPLAELVASGIPLMPVMAELDPPAFERQTLALVNALFERDGTMPHFLRLPGHNHFSSALHLNGEDGWLGERMADFIASFT